MDMRALAAALVLILSGTAPAQEASAPRNPRLLEMGDNAWLKLDPPRLPRGRTYSGGCMGEGVVWYFGGGHASYAYNDVELYDIAGNQWNQLTEREKWTEVKGASSMGGGSGVIVLSPKGRPFGEHTYQQFCWLPERQRFFGILTPGTWEFDPATKTWECLAGMHAGKLAGKAGPLQPARFKEGEKQTHNDVEVWKTRDGREVVAPTTDASRLKNGPAGWKTPDGKPVEDVGTPNPPGGGMHTGDTLVLYEPVLKRPLCFNSGNGWIFDFQKLAWEKYCDVPFKGLDMYSTYVPEQKCHVVTTSKGGWWRFHPETKETKPLKNVPEPLMGAQLLAYDPGNKVILTFPDKKKEAQTLWSFDPFADTFTQISTGPVPNPEMGARWGTFWYDPTHKVFLMLVNTKNSNLEGGPSETWAYRYRRPAQK